MAREPTATTGQLRDKADEDKPEAVRKPMSGPSLQSEDHGLAGPHAKESLTDHEATPGSGALPDDKQGGIDPGTG